MTRISSSFKYLTIGFSLGCIISYLTYQITNTYLYQYRKSTVKNAFLLGVAIKFPSIEDKTIFLDEFQPIAEYIRKYEYTTISYELLQSDKDNLKIYILERYRNKDVYLNIHKKSQPFLEFREKFQRLINSGTIVDGDSYYESGIGFI